MVDNNAVVIYNINSDRSVDVGYDINGRKGIIKNVHERRLSSAFCEFEEINDSTKYLVRTNDIEYIIPHEEDCCKVVHDEVAENYIKDVLKPTTNAEKFKEVFGFEPNTALTMCDLASCSDYTCNDNCPYETICFDWWNEKYTGEFHVDTN